MEIFLNVPRLFRIWYIQHEIYHLYLLKPANLFLQTRKLFMSTYLLHVDMQSIYVDMRVIMLTCRLLVLACTIFNINMQILYSTCSYGKYYNFYQKGKPYLSYVSI